MSRTVIKVGGSLFTRPRLSSELTSGSRRVEAIAAASQRVWIAGGGAAVEALRRADATNPQPATTTHWEAIRLMDANAERLAGWLPQAEPTGDWERLQRATFGDWVFAPGTFLREVEPGLPGVRLPVGWSVTSDSIAARVAERLEASLVLLKSRSLEGAGVSAGSSPWAAAAAAGYVDEHFPLATEAVSRVLAVAVEPARPGNPASAR